MRCKKCRSRRVTKAGFRITKAKRVQRYQCQKCGHIFIVLDEQQLLRQRAMSAVTRALEKGTLVRPASCELCGRATYLVPADKRSPSRRNGLTQGQIGPEAHHSDYTQPLKVTWLCKSCHKELHRNFGKGVN